MAYTPMDWKEESKKMLDYDGWGDDDSDESLPELICRPTKMYATDSSSSEEEEDEEDGPIPQWILDVRKYNEIGEEVDTIVELEVYEMESFEEVEESTEEEEEFEPEKPPFNVHDCASRDSMKPQIIQNSKAAQSTTDTQSYLESNVESAKDSTKAAQNTESDDDNKVETTELQIGRAHV